MIDNTGRLFDKSKSYVNQGLPPEKIILCFTVQDLILAAE